MIKPERIFFKSEKTTFSLPNGLKIKKWILASIHKEKKSCGEISFVFCSDSFLFSINKKYLHHSEYTDIISFDYSDKKTISGEIYISVERVKENAKKFTVSFSNELYRVMIHGVLHLIGYKDNNKKDRLMMKNKEDFYLSLFS